MKPIFQASAIVFATLVLAACGGSEGETETAADMEMMGGATMESTGDMDGMPGMEGMMQGGGMMEQMQAHMQMMDGMSGDSMMEMMPEHRQMTANMIAQMNREMRAMGMAADAEWNVVVDSLRQDLIYLPEMTAGELETFLPEHRARIDRLIEMHRGMMGSMNM